MFEQGKLDVIDIRGSFAAEVVQDGHLIPKLQEKGVQLFSAPDLATELFGINNSLALFKDNVKLRQAMSMAFDRHRYNELLFRGVSTVAQSIIPPGLAGYQEDFINPYNVYDLVKAKQLLAEAGYPLGQGLPTITLDIGPDTNARHQGAFFKTCMERVGIKIQVVTNIFPALMKKLDQKKTMVHTLSWVADYSDADTFLQTLYKGASRLGAYFNDDVYDALYEKATVMQPSAERTALYRQLNHIVAECVPVLCTGHPVYRGLYQGWVKNYCWCNFIYNTEQYIDVDLAQKKLYRPSAKACLASIL